MVLRGEGNGSGEQGSGSTGVLSPEQQAVQDMFRQMQQQPTQTDSRFPGLVYMGRERVPTTNTDPRAGDIRGPAQRDRFLTGEEAIMDFYAWEGKTRDDFIAQGKLSGLLSPDGGEMEAAALWERLVTQASFYGSQGVRMTPWDVLSTYVRQSGTSASGWRRDPSNPDFEVNMTTGERRYIGPQFKTQTDTAVNLTDPTTARAVGVSVFQQLMGRDPGEGELGAWAAALQAAEQNAPVTRTTTTEHDPVTGEIIGSNTETSGGLDAAGRQFLAEERVKDTQEYADVQAATTYANAFENAVFGAPQLGA